MDSTLASNSSFGHLAHRVAVSTHIEASELGEAEGLLLIASLRIFLPHALSINNVFPSSVVQGFLKIFSASGVCGLYAMTDDDCSSREQQPVSPLSPFQLTRLFIGEKRNRYTDSPRSRSRAKSMRSVSAVWIALVLVVAILAATTDAFVAPKNIFSGSTIHGAPPSSFAAQSRSASAQPRLVLLSAGFFGGGGGGGGGNNKKNDQERVPGGEKISKERRAQLGINADEDEYDLYFALDQNTDPVITKVIAGSFILVMIALLVYAVVIPSLTVYDEGICR